MSCWIKLRGWKLIDTMYKLNINNNSEKFKDTLYVHIRYPDTKLDLQNIPEKCTGMDYDEEYTDTITEKIEKLEKYYLEQCLNFELAWEEHENIINLLESFKINWK